MPEVTDPELLRMLNGGDTPAPERRGYIPGTPKAPAPPTPLQLNADARADRADARAAAADARAQAQFERDMAKPPAANGNEAKAAARAANLDSLVSQINRVQGLYNQNLRDEAIPLLSSLSEFLPTEDNRQFDASAAGLAEQGLAAFRVPGVGAQSDTELRQFVQANKPSASDYDSTIEEKLLQLRTRVDANRKALGLPPAQWDGLDVAPPAPQASEAPVAGVPPGGSPPPLEGGPPAPPPLSGGDPSYTAATGETRRVPDPETQSAFDALLRSGASYSEANAFAQSRGMAPVSPREYAEVRSFLKKNPGYQGALSSAFKNEPLDGYDQFVTGLVGGDPSGAAGYVAGAGQFLSGNIMDNIAGERGRQTLDILRAESPTASTLGDLSGGIIAGMTGEGLLARAGMAPGLLRGLIADSAMGAANGAGQADNGDRLSGLVRGGLSAAAGNIAGTYGTKAAASALNPTGGRLADLYGAGVRPTPGQRFAESGVVGRAVNATEEALQSVPIVGSAIRGAREGARDQFQSGAFNQALAEIGETLPKGMKPGTDPHKFAQEAFGRVYDRARSGMTMAADAELKNDLGNLAGDISTLGPQAQAKLKAIVANSINSKLAGGQLAGDAYKRAVSDLGKHTARLRKSAMGEDQALADVLDGVRDAMDASARRNSSPEAVELLDAADAGYAKLVVIEDAARRRGGDDGTFTPTQFNAAVQNTSGGVRSKRFLRGDAQMQDYARQGMSLADRMPNSGTTDRANTIGLVGAGAAGYLEPSVLGILGAIGGAYAPGVRKVTTGAMAPSTSGTAKAISAQLRKRARLVGAAGASSAVAALPGTSAGQ